MPSRAGPDGTAGARASSSASQLRSAFSSGAGGVRCGGSAPRPGAAVIFVWRRDAPSLRWWCIFYVPISLPAVFGIVLLWFAGFAFLLSRFCRAVLRYGAAVAGACWPSRTPTPSLFSRLFCAPLHGLVGDKRTVLHLACFAVHAYLKFARLRHVLCYALLVRALRDFSLPQTQRNTFFPATFRCAISLSIYFACMCCYAVSRCLLLLPFRTVGLSPRLLYKHHASLPAWPAGIPPC